MKRPLESILRAVRDGEMDALEAFARLGASLDDTGLGYAHLDMSRSKRCGFPEFIYGEGKTPEQISGIISALKKHKTPVLATRVSEAAARFILKKHPDAGYDKLARVIFLRKELAEKLPGMALILTAGTSDLPAALEARHSAEACGCSVELAADAGVAGIHRLFAKGELLRKASVIIAAAGMEGALPSVAGGLVSCPVIALPTSVGYGASMGGFAALFAMLNSCAGGVTVVNIDNGFGAGCAAARILRAAASLKN